MKDTDPDWRCTFVSLTRCSQLGSALGHCLLHHWRNLMLLLLWLGCSSNWLTMTLWLPEYMKFDITPMCSSCPSGYHQHNLLTPAHRLFSGNHFVYTAGTSCPKNPWLIALSKVWMKQQQVYSGLQDSSQYSSWS